MAINSLEREGEMLDIIAQVYRLSTYIVKWLGTLR